jgi:3-oxoacyl-[acyl-carrier-protein] synthase-1
METYIISDNVISPLGSTSTENFDNIVKGKSGIELINNGLSPDRAVYASGMGELDIADIPSHLSRFDAMCIASVRDALSRCGISGAEKDTLFILSTTKGNIQHIEHHSDSIDQASLDASAHTIASYFNSPNKPVVVSNACISGVLAIIVAKRMLASGVFRHAVVVGADELSRFVISGFQSLMAMSDEPCRPFDKDHKGVNLGEAAATVVMTTDRSLIDDQSVQVLGTGLTNDANHISGPSRTGLELADAVIRAMSKSNIVADDLSFLSAHGTATVYNDEMESNAFDHAGLNEVPVHSLKAYFGHTLGAAGLVESIMTIHSLRNNCILQSKNFDIPGVPKAMKVNKELIHSAKHYALKTASGFGGCNAAIVYGRFT